MLALGNMKPDIRKSFGWSLGLLALCLALPAALAASSWFKEIQVSSEPEVEGKKDFTVRLRPNQTHSCEAIEFECMYHQEFPWQDERGKTYTKIHEPASFVYRRKDVSMTDDLDRYVSFKVPMRRADLEEKYGPKTFHTNYPITVSQIKISGLVEGKPIWIYEVPAEGKIEMAALDQQTAARTNAEQMALEEAQMATNKPPKRTPRPPLVHKPPSWRF